MAADSQPSLEVYTPDGNRADTGTTTLAGPQEIAVSLLGGLGNGTYTATWRVVSTDTHPVSGEFTFSIGAPSATHVPALGLSPDPLTGAVLAVARWAEYAFFALLCGTVAFLITCWPAGARRRGVARLVAVSWAGLLAATLLGLLLQGPCAANAGPGRLLDPSLLRATLASKLGAASQSRELMAFLAGAAASLLLPRLPGSRPRGRVLNGCASRPLTLKVVSSLGAASPRPAALPIWVIGSDGGFLPAPVELSGKSGLPVLPSERYDIIVDFTGHKPGTHLSLANEGDGATRGTTSSVMRFTVVPLKSRDTSIPAARLALPKPPAMTGKTTTRRVAFYEQRSGFQTTVISEFPCGTVGADGIPHPLGWSDPVTEKPKYGSTEIWEVWNFSPEIATRGASHVFHMHLVQFEVLGRQPISGGKVSAPHPWERGRKDSCASPTGYITRVKAHFDHMGRYVWHCHFLDHEDNTMMRPFQVV